MNYYNVKSISNSGLIDRAAFHTFALDFGNLFDSMITSPNDIINGKRASFIESDEVWKVFDKESFDLALAMQESLNQNDFYRSLLDLQPETQREVHKWICPNTLQIHNEPYFGFYPVKGKYDFYCPKFITDLKTTSAKTHEEFLKKAHSLDYARAAAFYLDLDGTADEFVWLGVSKHAPHEIFVSKIEKGDKYYLKGRAKYQTLIQSAFDRFEAY